MQSVPERVTTPRREWQARPALLSPLSVNFQYNMRVKLQVTRGYGLRDALLVLCRDMKAVNDAIERQAPSDEIQRVLTHLELTFADLIENNVKP